MHALADLERRVSTVTSDGRKLTGYAIVFDTPSEDLGGFVEIIRPEAVDRTLRESLDVRALVDHRNDKVIGRTRSKTLTLTKDARGLLVEILPPDTTVGRDIVESVRRGDVTGMSFRFAVVRPHGERFETRSGTPTRIISDMRINEVSICTFPAYQATDVQVAQRSLQTFRDSHWRPASSIMRHRVRCSIL